MAVKPLHQTQSNSAIQNFLSCDRINLRRIKGYESHGLNYVTSSFRWQGRSCSQDMVNTYNQTVDATRPHSREQSQYHLTWELTFDALIWNNLDWWSRLSDYRMTCSRCNAHDWKKTSNKDQESSMLWSAGTKWSTQSPCYVCLEREGRVKQRLQLVH